MSTRKNVTSVKKLINHSPFFITHKIGNNRQKNATRGRLWKNEVIRIVKHSDALPGEAAESLQWGYSRTGRTNIFQE